MTNAEALQDFEVIASSFRSLYGAMDRKQHRYGFSFEKAVTEFRARINSAPNEPAFRGVYQEFLSLFHDAHLSLTVNVVSDNSHGFSLPLFIMPIENTYVVYSVSSGTTSVQVGDEVLSVGGVAPANFVATVRKYVSTPTELTTQHFAANMLTQRSSYMSGGIVDGQALTLRLRNTSGLERDVTLAWKESTHLVPPHSAVPNKDTVHDPSARSDSADQLIKDELTQFGSPTPFFMTKQAQASLTGATKVTPSATALKQFKLSKDAAAAVGYFALRYTTGTTNVLFVRLPDYEPQSAADALNYLRALFSDQQAHADVLVIDQTHNPGGSIPFAEGVVSLLAKQPFNRAVQAMHGDRAWIEQYATVASEVAAQDPKSSIPPVLMAEADAIDDAYSAQRTVSVPLPFPFDFGSPILPPDPSHWTKAVVVLADELSVSCADLVPLLVKYNSIGTVFGQTTMGGGGSVEEVATLPNSNAVLSLSRGLNTLYDPTAAYPDERFVEDNGVTPDIAYSHTLDDFRAGFVGYMAAVNAAVQSAKQ